MCSMCQFCGAAMEISNDCQDRENHLNSFNSNTGQPEHSCRSCGGKQEKDLAMRGYDSQAAPSISPSPSLTTSDSSVSSCSDFSVDACSYARDHQDEGFSCRGREDVNSRPNGHLRNLSLPIDLKASHRPNNVAKDESRDSRNVSNRCTAPKNVGNMARQDEKENGGSACIDGNSETSHSSKDEVDSELWLPPEAEDKEDEVEDSLANLDDDDDDDECGDGTKWGKPSSLSIFGEEGSGSFKFREGKQQVMDEVMNGKFKALVGQLLRSVGVSSSEEGSDNWVDIVTSLSWEAASFVKPVSAEGKAMDPEGYVKIKCVATGCRSQSKMIRGMVFKKRAAHKHMPTQYQKPKLLLIRGALGLSTSGLSSFESMQQEKDSMKSFIEMIEMWHPNVVLVEKAVSRDIQESIVQKGMTLVFDMKLHRLERVARCTGSPILSTDFSVDRKLRHCDSFHFEKFVEEHVISGDTGKRPSKTLMFIEGCPTRLGCTILLKGSHSDELKRIKSVVQCAVVMAYHFILETSFILDQRAMFSTILFNELKGASFADWQSQLVQSKQNSTLSCPGETSTDNDRSCTVDLPIYNSFNEEGSINLKLEVDGNPVFSYEPYNPVFLSGQSSLSAPLKKVIGDNLPLFSSASRQSMSTYFGVDESQISDPLHVSPSSRTCDLCDLKIQGNSNEDKIPEDYLSNSTTDCCGASLDITSNAGDTEGKVQTKDDINSVLNNESILVLMSSRNASRGTVCEQSHLSHIKFYRNFDVPLGKFLQDNLLNQNLKCANCNEPPESHFYYYAHHNKQLTFQVKRLPDRCLPGQDEGKLWMWSRCGSCNGNSKSTKRVLISRVARGLSFGKFLELSFSNFSSSSQLSSCGHSMQRDFLYFFGLGPMVALLRYSQVAIYSVSLPPQNLKFCSPILSDSLEKEIENVYTKGIHIFEEIAKSLDEVASTFSSSSTNITGTSLEEMHDIEELLQLEKSHFEMDIQNVSINGGNQDEAAYILLRLNRLLYNLVLESCIWDQRFQSLLSSDSRVHNYRTTGHYLEEEGTVATEKRALSSTDEVRDDKVDSQELSVQEIPIEESEEQDESSTSSVVIEEIEASTGSIGHHTLLGDMDDIGGGDSQRDCHLKGWIWTEFRKIPHENHKDILRGYPPTFQSIRNVTGESFRNALGLISEEGPRMHIPLGKNDYMVSDYKDELSSIIACVLAHLKDHPVCTETSSTGKVYETSRSLPRISSLNSPYWSSVNSFDSDGTLSPPSLEVSSLSSFDGLNLLDSLGPLVTVHPKISLAYGTSTEKGVYSVLCLYENQFRDLRNQCCRTELDYIASLSRCKNWDAKGGKSKSLFAKTLDGRFIIKEIKKTEFDSFTTFAPHYFKYMNECFEQGNQTCLAKILGIYQVNIRPTKNGKETRHDVMVMENLSFGRKISRQYDLKGALFDRFTAGGDGSEDVFLDQNFIDDMKASPLYIGTKSKRHLERAVWNDTTFLNSVNVMDYSLLSVNVMDYSLLVGVDSERHELVCGIIDYLRQYTWDKQLETWVKSSLVVPKNQLPTVISPKDYSKRFRRFITARFVSVPDRWCSQRSTNPCKLCGSSSSAQEDDSPSSSSSSSNAAAQSQHQGN